MRMIIERMHLENFKGARDVTIDFGHMTSISGDNGTGKTTIPDAFCWVLWNKDSHGRAPGTPDFHEKPLDADGNELHNLDTTVELQCRLDGSPFNFRRTQRENWVKKRGRVESTFQGNVSTYWINDVEVKLSEFKERIDQIASEEVFQLIGRLGAFADKKMDWKKRREQLLAMVDADADKHLLERDEYRSLAEECRKRGIQIDDLRKVLGDQRKRANDELNALPIRIDEARKALPTFNHYEVDQARYVVDDNRKQIEKIDGYIAEERAKAAKESHAGTIAALEQELRACRAAVEAEHNGKRTQLRNDAANAEAEYRSVGGRLQSGRMRLADLSTQLRTQQTRRDMLRLEYNKRREERFEWSEDESVCPVCGQMIPADMVASHKEKALLDFKVKQSADLERIGADGKSCKELIEKLQSDIEVMENAISELQKQFDGQSEEYQLLEADLAVFSEYPDYTVNPRIAELEKQIADLQAQETKSPDEHIAGLEARKAELQDGIDRNRAILARYEAGKATEQRIAELEQQQKDKAVQVAQLEQMIALAEKFVQDRCRMLEDSINEKFPTVRWKLFATQINGGITDVCEALVPGRDGLVSYNGTNTAAQVNADIEIVNVLSKHYDLYLPLFHDNAESVNRLTPTDSQFIALRVSHDKELTVTIDDSRKEAAA